MYWPRASAPARGRRCSCRSPRGCRRRERAGCCPCCFCEPRPRGHQRALTPVRTQGHPSGGRACARRRDQTSRRRTKGKRCRRQCAAGREPLPAQGTSRSQHLSEQKQGDAAHRARFTIPVPPPLSDVEHVGSPRAGPPLHFQSHLRCLPPAIAWGARKWRGSLEYCAEVAAAVSGWVSGHPVLARPGSVSCLRRAPRGRRSARAEPPSADDLHGCGRA